MKNNYNDRHFTLLDYDTMRGGNVNGNILKNYGFFVLVNEDLESMDPLARYLEASGKRVLMLKRPLQLQKLLSSIHSTISNPALAVYVSVNGQFEPGE